MSNRIKKYYNFVAFMSGTKSVIVCMAFLFASHTALQAVNDIGYHSNGCCAAKPVIVPDRTEKGSLSSFTNLNFLSMSGTAKNASAEKNSNAPANKPHKGIYPNYSKDITAITAINKRYDTLFDECKDPSIKLSIMQVQLSLAESITLTNWILIFKIIKFKGRK